ncbi:lysophospholipid acyltransferase family protein [Taibaiella koreensis]|uniref:lysophospholipid acyltransferase family protein n=1 Tax=Taibaiella koreensis TaxID=1268548 RepID=UPI000E59F204|nr:lysophospholipid acyltransferase family protein [Taibaiella koreensis]
MRAVFYYLSLPFLYLLSLLPFPLFYALSDLFYLILFYMVGYRKGLVLQNLQRSFPEKTEVELKKIRRKFYRHLCDLFLETFKTLTISRAAMLRHCSFEPASKQLLNDYAAQGQSVILVMGHQGNWEWAGNTCSLEVPGSQLYVIYHPLANPYMNGLITKMRRRFGTDLIAMKDTFKEMVAHRSQVTTTAFIADQTPQPDNAHWMTFLHQDTPVFLGTERIARKLKYPVVYAFVRKVKRGYYQIHVENLFENPATTGDGEITEAHTHRLEQDIMMQPETWLWSHRRWKHKRP